VYKLLLSITVYGKQKKNYNVKMKTFQSDNPFSINNIIGT